MRSQCFASSTVKIVCGNVQSILSRAMERRNDHSIYNESEAAVGRSSHRRFSISKKHLDKEKLLNII